jgi:hypothetical protein
VVNSSRVTSFRPTRKRGDLEVVGEDVDFIGFRLSHGGFKSEVQQRYEARIHKVSATDPLKERGTETREAFLTFDNGTESHSYKVLEGVFPVKCYFAMPYHSWEHGTTEILAIHIHIV